MKRAEFKGLAEQARRESVSSYAVGALIVEGGRVLIVKRKTDDFFGGFYEIPGGGVQGSESLKDAVKRETSEETGLKVTDIVRYLGSFDYESESGERTRQFNFLVRTRDCKVRLGGEHTLHIWASRDDIAGYLDAGDKVRTVIEEFWKRNDAGRRRLRG